MTGVTGRPTEGFTVVFAGGGSGGHLSPGLAVAEALHERDPGIRMLFICSSRAIDRSVLEGAGVDFAPVPAAPFSLRPRGLVRFLASLRTATARSRELLAGSRASVVLALGGFVSVPVVRAARAAGVPVILLNLDAVAGRANRVVARSCRRILSATATRGLPAGRVDVVGMPVRRAAHAPAPPEACRERLGLDAQRPTLLVTGASQGSRSLNEALPGIVGRRRELFRGWQVLHLCGLPDGAPQEALRGAYRRAGVPAVVIGFLHEMGTAWGAASLAVSRAGASSVAEAEFNRVPTIFVPFPHHRDEHQRRNAAALVDAGASLLARDPIVAHGSDPALEEVVTAVVSDRERLDELTRRIRARPHVNAAGVVADVLLASITSSGDPSTRPGS